jgi:trehalose 6-phosphate phosphatase
VQHVVGNHGLEPALGMAGYARATAAMRQALALLLPAQAGIEIEDKRYSLAVHYRHARRQQAARKLILRASTHLPRPPRIVLGKSVVNLLPAGAPHKGDALQRLRARTGLDAALFVGDDVTDEDVFGSCDPDRLLAIRVGRSRASAAPFYLRDQHEIDGLLARLIALRSGENSA